MAISSKKILLVEGEQDRDFFVTILRCHGMQDVFVHPPKDIDPSVGNGWTNVLKQIPSFIDQIKQSDGIESFGIVIDADYPGSQGGFSVRFNTVELLLKQAGYLPRHSQDRGGIFDHEDGLPSIGLWLMPDHEHDGMLEDFVGQAVTLPEQLQLLTHADNSIAQLLKPLFRVPLDNSKARISTWRSWQRKPGGSLGQCFKDGALDASHPPLADFIHWLKTIFL